jgi:intein/homing endonuclease
VTLSGQLTIRWAINHLNDFLNKTLKTNNVDFCLGSDTDSLKSDAIINVDGKDITIGEFFETCEGEYLRHDDFNQQYVKRTKQTQSALTYDGEKCVQRPISYVMKHVTNKEMFEIEVDGRTLQVTENHSLVVERDGTVMVVTPAQVKDGDRLILID